MLSEDLVDALQDNEVSLEAKANIVRQRLLTQDQRIRLYELGYSLEDVIDGQNIAPVDMASVMQEFYRPWNEECDRYVFYIDA